MSNVKYAMMKCLIGIIRTSTTPAFVWKLLAIRRLLVLVMAPWLPLVAEPLVP